MINDKTFMQGFLQYLQSYYGNGGMVGTPSAPMYPNQPRLNLFQQAPVPAQEAEAMGMEDTAYLGVAQDQPLMPGQNAGMMGGGGMPGQAGGLPALPGETLGSELNGMFPGPYDPMRMN